MAFPVLKETFLEWKEDKCPRLAAALAFYTLFALAPLVLVVVSVAALVFGDAAARSALVAQVAGLVGPAGGAVVEEVLASAPRPQAGVMAFVGFAVLLAGATGVVGQLQDAMNTIWGVQPRKTGWLRRMLLKRLLSLAFVAGIAFLLLVSLALTAGTAALASRYAFPMSFVGLGLLDLALTLVVFTGVLAVAYNFLPDVKVAWRDVWTGAFVTALLLVLGKMALGLYLGRGTFGTAFGAAGSLAVLLAWVYYSGLIFFLGAEYTQVHAARAGRPIRPDRGAVPIVPEHRIDRPSRGPEAGDPGVPGGSAALYVAGAATLAMLGWMAKQAFKARRRPIRARSKEPGSRAAR